MGRSYQKIITTNGSITPLFTWSTGIITDRSTSKVFTIPLFNTPLAENITGIPKMDISFDYWLTFSGVTAASYYFYCVGVKRAGTKEAGDVRLEITMVLGDSYAWPHSLTFNFF